VGQLYITVTEVEELTIGHRKKAQVGKSQTLLFLITMGDFE
jgi:hypothetical protein